MLEGTITTSPLEKSIIERAVHDTRAARVLEVGAFHGETTAVLRRAALRHKGYVVVVDPMRWVSQPADFIERVGGGSSARTSRGSSGTTCAEAPTTTCC